MENLNHIMQMQLQGIHDRSTADEAANLLQQSRLKLNSILHLLYQIDLPPELERQKISIESTIGRMLLIYRAELKNKKFYGSDKLRHAMHDFFTPAANVYPSRYTTLSQAYDTALQHIITLLGQATDSTSAQAAAESMNYAARSLRSIHARMQMLDISPGLNQHSPTRNPSLLPQLQNHIRQLQNQNYYDSPELRRTCETLFLPISDNVEYMDMLAQQECDLYTTILDYWNMIDDDTSANDALFWSRPWMEKLHQLHAHMEQIAPPSAPAQHTLLSQRRTSAATPYSQAILRLMHHLENNKYYGSSELERNMKTILRTLDQRIEPSIREAPAARFRQT